MSTPASRSSQYLFIIITTITTGLLLSLPCRANLSDEVAQAMDEASVCNTTVSDYIYTVCMQANNKRIKKWIVQKSQQQLQQYPSDKKETIKQNIDRKISSARKLCLTELALNNNNPFAQRRHLYCLYENTLEILINVEQRIGLYAR